MLRDVTIGQYYQGQSVIHELDPRVKLTGTLVFIVSLFAFGSISSYIFATICLAAVIGLTKIPVSYMLRGLRAIFVLMLVTAVFDIFLTPGEELLKIWKLTVTREGVQMAVHMAFRLTYLILGSSVLTLTTTPNRLTDGLESLLGGLRRFHVPVSEIAMMMSIALRFIPILMDEADKIMRAQEARGADFHSGNLIQRAKALVPLLVPLFLSAFRRANDLALAMESRCYNTGAVRTRMKVLRLQRRDYIAIICIVLYLIVMIGLCRFVR